MPITPFLHGERFDPETKRVLGLSSRRQAAKTYSSTSPRLSALD
jgi:hypothetical protein